MHIHVKDEVSMTTYMDRRAYKRKLPKCLPFNPYLHAAVFWHVIPICSDPSYDMLQLSAQNGFRPANFHSFSILIKISVTFKRYDLLLSFSAHYCYFQSPDHNVLYDIWIYKGFFVHTPRGQSVVPCLSHQKKRVKPQQINVVM